jgi:murein L,D-transpeptidase YafK
MTAGMQRTFIFGLIFLVCAASSEPQAGKTLRDTQWQFPRVRLASKEKDEVMRRKVEAKKIAYPPRAILLRAFKKEGQLELWAANSETEPYTLVETYTICATSGTLGPKRRFGDTQVPEGFYLLDWFNPQSNFFLSMHISYPNACDRILGSHENPGGDIFLHGNCASIGCIPITDDGIKEVYWLAVLAKSAGLKEIPMEIFPARLTESGYKTLSAGYRNQPELVAFWGNLKTGFDLFETTHRLPRIKTREDGTYVFAEEIVAGVGR